jgi:hypothetical protein
LLRSGVGGGEKRGETAARVWPRAGSGIRMGRDVRSTLTKDWNNTSPGKCGSLYHDAACMDVRAVAN